MDGKTAGALFFWGLAFVTVVPAVLLLVVRDVIRCAMLLLATLAGVAGLFILLGADFLGMVQVLVYIGGILILLMYGVMLTDRDPVLLQRVKDKGLVAPALIAGFFLLLPTVYVAIAIAGPAEGVDGKLTPRFKEQSQLPSPALDVSEPTAAEREAAARKGKPVQKGSARRIGELLMTDYILPFEVISLLLLAALVGAAYIARMGGEEGDPTHG